MAWGWWQKVKNWFKKAGQWVKNKVITPVVKFFKPVVQKILPLAPAIGAAIGGAKGNPAAGAKIGSVVQGIGGALFK